ncbi:hypothetical protein [Ruminococcus sp.]|jgi:hypothetical protein|nr:hypothetical protein [Ruminococcus sp.]
MNTYSSDTDFKKNNSVKGEYGDDTIIRIISFPFGGTPFVTSRGRF